MANSFEKAAGLGAQGFALGGPVGGLVGAGLGFLFGSDDQPQLGDFNFSPDSLRSMNFGDIDLQSMNPELYKKLQQNDYILQDLRQALNERRDAMTANESRQTEDYLNRQASGQASSGLAGTPIGNAMMADSAARLYDQARERAYQEAAGLRQQVSGQANANLAGYANAQGQLINQFNNNRNSSIQMDELRNQRELAKYQDQQASVNANTNFYGGLLNGGLSGLASQAYTGSGPLLGNWGDGLGAAGGWIASQFSPNQGNPNGFIANHGSIPSWNGGAEFPNYYPAVPSEPYAFNPGGHGYGQGMYR
jgi:hypothetical protein